MEQALRVVGEVAENDRAGFETFDGHAEVRRQTGANLSGIAKATDATETGGIANGDDGTAGGDREAGLLKGTHRVGGGGKFKFRRRKEIFRGEAESFSKSFWHEIAFTPGWGRARLWLREGTVDLTALAI